MGNLKTGPAPKTQLRGLLLKGAVAYLTWGAYVYGPPEFRVALLGLAIGIAVAGDLIGQQK